MTARSVFSSLLAASLLASTVYCGNDDDFGGDVTQIHINQGKTPSTMIISWHTKYQDLSDDSEVRYSTNPDVLDNSNFGDASFYTFNSLEFDEYTSGYFHHVEITNLLPDTKYYYRAGDFSEGRASETLSFTTQHAVGDMSEMWVGVVGDLGQTADSKSTLAHLEANRHFNMIVHVGDLGYANCDQGLWDTYGDMVQPLASVRPWMVGPGNHEIEAYNEDGSYFKAFETRYRMPAHAPATFGDVIIPPGEWDGHPSCTPSVFLMEYDFGNAYYSYDSGSLHTIFLSCYSTADVNSTQYAWLESDLKKVDRSVTPWVLVSMHCPWYNSNTAHYEEKQTTMMRDSMEGLFNEYHVNLAVQGHVHAYERSKPVNNFNVTSDGVVYITIGDGGNAEGHAATYEDPAPAWSAFTNGTQYGHGVVHVINETHMEWEWHRNIDGEHTVRDSFVLCNTGLGLPADCNY